MSGRIRTLKPEWLDDELLAASSDAARLLSAGLILMADDHGRGRASIAQIATSVWKFQMDEAFNETGEKASRALRELVEIRFVRVYEVQRQRYFEIRNWKKHQRVDHPSAPRVPAPIAAESDDSRDPPETLPTSSRGPRETLAPDPDLRSPISISEKDRSARETNSRAEIEGAIVGGFGAGWKGATGDGWMGHSKASGSLPALVRWASEKPDPISAIQESLAGFFAEDGSTNAKWLADKRWPFASWAADPGRYAKAQHAASAASSNAQTDANYDPVIHDAPLTPLQTELHNAWIEDLAPHPWPRLEPKRAELMNARKARRAS